jgi:DNA polymerase-4
MDAFFASVEKALDPSLAGKPVIVGAPPHARGVVSAASYEARKYGVHSAMPSRTAGRLCPNGVFLPPDFDAYKRYHERLMAILEAASPIVEPLSLDEAFVDLTGCERLYGWIPAKARALKDQVKEELGLTCSVGLGTSRVVAKIASDFRKPEGATIVTAGNEAIFLAPLIIERMPGIGKVTAKRLRLLGYRTLGDIQQAAPDTLRRQFGDHGLVLARRARGQGSSSVLPDTERKQVSKEHTFDSDTADPALLLGTLHYMSERVASRMRSKGWAGRTATLKLRHTDFTTLTRRVTLADATDLDSEIWRVACELFDETWVPGTPVRLIGIGMSGLCEAGAQLALFEEMRRTGSPLDEALDAIRGRYGVDSVTRGDTQELRRRWAARPKADPREE